jgi:hypothetical protein
LVKSTVFTPLRMSSTFCFLPGNVHGNHKKANHLNYERT